MPRQPWADTRSRAPSKPGRKEPLRAPRGGDEQLQCQLVFHALEVPNPDPVAPCAELDITALGGRAVHAVVVRRPGATLGEWRIADAGVKAKEPTKRSQE